MRGFMLLKIQRWSGLQHGLTGVQLCFAEVLFVLLSVVCQSGLGDQTVVEVLGFISLDHVDQK